MAEHQNTSIVRALFDASARQDVDGVLNLLADDVVFHIPGSSPIAGTYRGKDEALAFWGRLAQLSDAPPQSELLHALTDGESTAVAVWKTRASRKGQILEDVLGYIFELRDGKIASARNLAADPEAADRFWSA